MTRAIYKYEMEENKRRQPMIAEQEAQLNKWRAQIEKYERKGLRDEADTARRQCYELEQRRIRPLRLIADDITPEALTSLMADNNGIITVISTEGGLFDIFNGKYSSNVVSIDTVLKAYSGDPIRVDRKGREAECLDAPALLCSCRRRKVYWRECSIMMPFGDEGLPGAFYTVSLTP